MSKPSPAELRRRLLDCFAVVFPDLPREALTEASVESVSAWDSVAAITLLNVIEEQFQVSLDLDRAGELQSFTAIEAHLTERIWQ